MKSYLWEIQFQIYLYNLWTIPSYKSKQKLLGEGQFTSYVLCHIFLDTDGEVKVKIERRTVAHLIGHRGRNSYWGIEPPFPFPPPEEITQFSSTNDIEINKQVSFLLLGETPPSSFLPNEGPKICTWKWRSKRMKKFCTPLFKKVDFQISIRSMT